MGYFDGGNGRGKTKNEDSKICSNITGVIKLLGYQGRVVYDNIEVNAIDSSLRCE